MAGDFQTALGDVGGAVSALYGAKGANASADSYDIAQNVAAQNAILAEQATRIKDAQLKRQIFKTLGTQQAQVGGAGFSASGSALDLLRSSASEGAMTRAINEEKGAITANSYIEQAGRFGALASAARASAKGQGIAGLIQGGGALYKLYGGAKEFLGGFSSAVPAAAGDVAGSVDWSTVVDAGITATAAA